MTIDLDRPATGIRMLELEITHRCQLCRHCLTRSSPAAEHGAMGLADWLAVVDQARALGIAGIQVIGGEPLLSPHCLPVLEHALALGMDVEIFSNLHTVSNRTWDLLRHPNARLATSYYSSDPGVHDRVTRYPGSHARNRANILKALERGINLRIGIIEVVEEQGAEAARDELVGLGIPAERIGIDRARKVGRAADDPAATPELTELCGQCGIGRAAILADGTLAPCVLGRFLICGNVRARPLSDLLAEPAWAASMDLVPRSGNDPCQPAKDDGNDCTPASTTACSPAYSKPPPTPPQPR